jgi:hypothetical protein
MKENPMAATIHTCLFEWLKGGKGAVLIRIIRRDGPAPRDVGSACMVDADGNAAAKVFKLKTVDLGPGEAIKLKKSISLADMTTQRHYPGKHHVGAIVNGKAMPLGAFQLIKAKK